MPKVSNTSKNEANNVVANENIDEKDILIKQLMEKVESLSKMVLENQNNSDDKKVSVQVDNQTDYTEPNPNKQIRIVSMCYGTLNLSTEPFGRGKLVTFNKYGESKTVLYSALIDIVNNNRSFAEEGKFYILDKDAVYYLGLSDYYNNIFNKDIIDNILNYSPSEITDFLNNMVESQKEVLVRNIIDKIYNNKSVDLNKCDLISKLCNIDILSKVSEMREISNITEIK